MIQTKQKAVTGELLSPFLRGDASLRSGAAPQGDYLSEQLGTASTEDVIHVMHSGARS